MNRLHEIINLFHHIWASVSRILGLIVLTEISNGILSEDMEKGRGRVEGGKVLVKGFLHLEDGTFACISEEKDACD